MDRSHVGLEVAGPTQIEDKELSRVFNFLLVCLNTKTITGSKI